MYAGSLMDLNKAEPLLKELITPVLSVSLSKASLRLTNQNACCEKGTYITTDKQKK